MLISVYRGRRVPFKGTYTRACSVVVFVFIETLRTKAGGTAASFLAGLQSRSFTPAIISSFFPGLVRASFRQIFVRHLRDLYDLCETQMYA